MLNPEVLKCHEDLNTGYICTTRKTMDIKLYILVKTLTSLAISLWGHGGGFHNQTGPILVHIYPLFNHNLHVKYRSNLIKTF